MAGGEMQDDLGRMARQLESLDLGLRALTAEMQARAGALDEEAAEALLDRLDEMMDLLYLIDEHLTALGETLADRDRA